jgi:hypothetical protein
MTLEEAFKTQITLADCENPRLLFFLKYEDSFIVGFVQKSDLSICGMVVDEDIPQPLYPNDPVAKNFPVLKPENLNSEEFDPSDWWKRGESSQPWIKN